MSLIDLYLLGSGIKGNLQFSVESIQALQVCRVAYVLHDDLAVHSFIRKHCADVRDLIHIYKEHSERKEVYRSIAELLIAESKSGPGVAFVVHGHPLFLVSATDYLLELSERHEIKIRVLPAVSSFDTILCDLGFDYGYGLQILEATTMINRRWKPNPSIPALVFQLATVMNPLVTREAPPPLVLKPLVEHLSSSYPSTHKCTIVYSATHVLEQSTLVDIPLGDLHKSNQIELWRRPTLYVPAIDPE